MEQCGVTKEHIATVQKTWQAVYKDKENSGVFLFNVLFEIYPDYERFFVRFKKPGQTSLFDNPDFQHHIKHLVMDALDAMITNLDNQEELKKILETVAVNHRKRNVKKHEFEGIGKVVLETLRRALGEVYTLDVEEAWTKVVTCAMTHIGTITG